MRNINIHLHILLTTGKHSTKGCGATVPDESNSATLEADGVKLEVPLGPPVTDRGVKKPSLLYNEYIVYDVAQVRCHFLVKVKFIFKF